MALSPGVALWLKTLGHDAVHASELSLSRAADIEVLSTALDHGRIIITADLDFSRLLAILGADGSALILLRGGDYSVSESVVCVRRVLLAIPHDELTKSVVVVDRKKIRRSVASYMTAVSASTRLLHHRDRRRRILRPAGILQRNPDQQCAEKQQEHHAELVRGRLEDLRPGLVEEAERRVYQAH